VLDLLDLRTRETVLDVGCGHGVLASHVLEAGATYTGVDGSPRLLEVARKRYGARARFVLADATRLEASPLGGEAFDAAVFLLSIQDIDPLEPAIASAAELLRPGGRMVILMTHPAFRIPRQSGWGWDESRKLRYRRVDAYLSRMSIPLAPSTTRRVTSMTFHRPLGAYIEAIAAGDLLVDAIRELPPLDDARSGRSSKAEAAANREFPLFLAIRAWKVVRADG
jgi:SAM-dependent methyltransferase